MRKVVSAVLTATLLLAATGCTGGPVDPAGAVDEDPYSDAALRYGLAPVPHPDLTYQPDVVLVGGGRRSVRSVTADGLTWRIDGAAPRADDLAPGKIMFVTGRGVGRVLDLHRDGGDLLVTIGPVTVTDVIRDGTLEKRGVAIENPVVYQAGEPIWAMSEEEADPLLATPSGRAGRSAPMRLASLPPRPAQPPPTRGGGEVRSVAANFSTGVSLNSGAEVSFNYHRNGTKLSGRAALTFVEPKADFHLSIKGGSVTRADLSMAPRSRPPADGSPVPAAPASWGGADRPRHRDAQQPPCHSGVEGLRGSLRRFSPAGRRSGSRACAASTVRRHSRAPGSGTAPRRHGAGLPVRGL